MKEKEKLILQVKGNINGQKRVTIPQDSEIKEDDYVEVKKIQ
jgi:hypothetical protein